MSLVLVIEDQEDACGLVQRLLMRMGHTVVCVEHASEADLWLRSNSPELVILGTGRQGELALERLQVLERHGVEGSRVLLGARADARELVIRKYGHKVREVFDSPQGLDGLEAMVRRAFQARADGRGEEGERSGAERDAS